jgi:hypothetical protein
VFDCSRMAVVVPSRRDGIDEGHNQAHELSGSKENRSSRYFWLIPEPRTRWHLADELEKLG